MNRCLSFWRKQRPGFSQTDPHALYWEQPQGKYKRFVLCFSNLFCQTWREENWWPDLILLSTISNSMEMTFWYYYHRPKRVGKVLFLRFTSNDGFLWFSCVIQNLWCITIAALISAASCGADWNISPYAIFFVSLVRSWISWEDWETLTLEIKAFSDWNFGLPKRLGHLLFKSCENVGPEQLRSLSTTTS